MQKNAAQSALMMICRRVFVKVLLCMVLSKGHIPNHLESSVFCFSLSVVLVSDIPRFNNAGVICMAVD